MKKNLTYGRQRLLIVRFFQLFHAIVLTALFGFAWMTYYEPYLPATYGINSNIATLLFYCVVIICMIRVYNGFQLGNYRVSELALAQCLGSLLTNGLFSVILLFLLRKTFNLWPMLCVTVCQTLVGCIWAFLMNMYYFKHTPPEKILVVYRKQTDLEKIRQIPFFDKKYEIVQTICNPDDYHLVVDNLLGKSAVFVAGINPVVRNGIVKYCMNKGIPCYIAPKVGDMIMEGAEHMQMFGLPIMRVRRANLMPEYAFVKRLFDICASLLALIILSPFMLLTALAIKLTDNGPVFYKQTRLTKDKTAFKMIKFRSMRVDAEKDGVARLASEHDNRITPIGKIIRACRIDELPQLINILKGDMSIVGPRPERPEIEEQYRKINAAFDLRLQVRAGLTGYAQVYGKYNTDPYDKLQLDLLYINDMSVTMDIRLMLATVFVLFKRESTEGVKNGQVTAADDEYVQENEQKAG